MISKIYKTNITRITSKINPKNTVLQENIYTVQHKFKNTYHPKFKNTLRKQQIIHRWTTPGKKSTIT